MSPPVLVLGVGNLLMQDEGVGVRVVELLRNRYELPETVEILDGGTAGMELLYPMRGRERLIIADAVNTGAPPGTLVRLADQEIPAFFRTKLSPHQLGLSDLLALLQLQGHAPRQVSIIGIVPASLDYSLNLSPLIAAKLPEMLDWLLQELARAGIAPVARAQPLEAELAWIAC